MLRRLALFGDRIAPTVLAVYFTAATVGMFQQWLDCESIAFYPALWPWVFLAAAISLVAYTFHPNHTLGAIAGSLMVGAVVSRGMTLVFSWQDGTLPFWRAYLGAITWSILGWALAKVWLGLLELRG